MPKYRSKKFWVIFWTLSAAFLVVWSTYWQYQSRGLSAFIPVAKVMPLSDETQKDVAALLRLADETLRDDGITRNYLVLFQNNLELRPGGGHLGTFGIVKMKDKRVVGIETHDLSNYDKTVASGQTPPYPLEEILGVASWKMRDANFSPDFSVNAQKTEELYHKGRGKENFDGIIAVNSGILTSLLKVTGPVELPDYPGEYNSENAILALEYQVEKGYLEQGIEKEDRKSVMDALAEAIIDKIHSFNWRQNIQLAFIIIKDLNNKDIQLFFKNAELEKYAAGAGWAGLVEKDWQEDYLMMVDANIGAWKSDYYVKRSFEYVVDLQKDIPTATLKITYRHSGKVRDWMTKNYLTYLRVYVPEGSFLHEQKNFDDTKFGNEFGKKYFGALVLVPLGQEKTVELKYDLPKKIAEGRYELLIQKQSGVSNLPGKFVVISKDGKTKESTVDTKRDWIMAN